MDFLDYSVNPFSLGFQLTTRDEFLMYDCLLFICNSSNFIYYIYLSYRLIYFIWWNYMQFFQFCLLYVQLYLFYVLSYVFIFIQYTDFFNIILTLFGSVSNQRLEMFYSAKLFICNSSNFIYYVFIIHPIVFILS